jgi:glycosyltransferase involved in cell wall biosynthesis
MMASFPKGDSRQMPAVLYMSMGYPDARGVKWVSALRAAGLSVVVLRGRGPRTLGTIWLDDIDGVEIESMEQLCYKLPLQRAVAKGVYDRIAAWRPDAIIVRDVFLAGYALSAAERCEVPCYVDVADNYPEVIRSIAHPELVGYLGYGLLNKWERHMLRRAAGVIVVSPESKLHIMRKHGLPGSRIRIVENVPRHPDTRPSSAAVFSGRLVYIGTYDRGIRDLDTVISGLRKYNSMFGGQAHLTVHAFQPGKVDRALRSQRDYGDFVTIAPPVEHLSLYETLRKFDAGVVPHCKCPATEYTIPNKLYDYLHAGIRVICSDNPPFKRVLNDVGGGVTYSAGDPEDFARSLFRLESEIGQGRCHTDVGVLASKYEWDKQIRSLIEQLQKATYE